MRFGRFLSKDIVAGIALIAIAVATGEADVSLFVIVPVFSGSSIVFLLAILLIISSFVVGFVLMAMEREGSEEEIQTGSDGASKGTLRPKMQYGGVVLLGPIPIAFGSDKRIALIMLAVGVIIAIVVIGLLWANA